MNGIFNLLSGLMGTSKNKSSNNASNLSDMFSNMQNMLNNQSNIGPKPQNYQESGSPSYATSDYPQSFTIKNSNKNTYRNFDDYLGYTPSFQNSGQQYGYNQNGSFFNTDFIEKLGQFLPLLLNKKGAKLDSLDLIKNINPELAQVVSLATAKPKQDKKQTGATKPVLIDVSDLTETD